MVKFMHVPSKTCGLITFHIHSFSYSCFSILRIFAIQMLFPLQSDASFLFLILSMECKQSSFWWTRDWNHYEHIKNNEYVGNVFNIFWRVYLVAWNTSFKMWSFALIIIYCLQQNHWIKSLNLQQNGIEWKQSIRSRNFTIYSMDRSIGKYD